MDGAGSDVQVDLVQRLQAAELHQYLLYLQQIAARGDAMIGRGPYVGRITVLRRYHGRRRDALAE